MTSDQPEYLSLQQGAERLNCSKSTLRRYIAHGRVRAYRMGHKVLKVDARELDALMRPIPTAASDGVTWQEHVLRAMRSYRKADPERAATLPASWYQLEKSFSAFVSDVNADAAQ